MNAQGFLPRLRCIYVHLSHFALHLVQNTLAYLDLILFFDCYLLRQVSRVEDTLASHWMVNYSFTQLGQKVIVAVEAHIAQVVRRFVSLLLVFNRD